MGTGDAPRHVEPSNSVTGLSDIPSPGPSPPELLLTSQDSDSDGPPTTLVNPESQGSSTAHSRGSEASSKIEECYSDVEEISIHNITVSVPPPKRRAYREVGSESPPPPTVKRIKLGSRDAESKHVEENVSIEVWYYRLLGRNMDTWGLFKEEKERQELRNLRYEREEACGRDRWHQRMENTRKVLRKEYPDTSGLAYTLELEEAMRNYLNGENDDDVNPIAAWLSVHAMYDANNEKKPAGVSGTITTAYPSSDKDADVTTLFHEDLFVEIEDNSGSREELEDDLEDYLGAATGLFATDIIPILYVEPGASEQQVERLVSTVVNRSLHSDRENGLVYNGIKTYENVWCQNMAGGWKLVE